jgi:hypothetical protein
VAEKKVKEVLIMHVEAKEVAIEEMTGVVVVIDVAVVVLVAIEEVVVANNKVVEDNPMLF